MKTRLIDSSMVGTLEEAVDIISTTLEASKEYCVIGTAMEATILLSNEGARHSYGYEAEEVVGKLNGSILQAPEDVLSDKHPEMLNEALREEKWVGTLRRIRRNGVHFTARMVVRPRFDFSEKPIGYLYISKRWILQTTKKLFP